MDPAPPVQTDEQPKAGPGAEEMPVDPILESPGARHHVREPIAAVGGLGGDEHLTSTANELTIAPSATAGTAGSSGVDTLVTSVTPKSRAKNLAVPKEQTALLEASEGMVGPAIRPPSPQVVPLAAAEEDEVEEIEHDEPQPQAVRILRKRGDDIVIVEEEDTTREFRRLETALVEVMKQIKVSTASVMLFVDVGNWILTLSLCICRR